MERRTPLYRRMRRERHRQIARLQDIIVETLYRIFPKSVLHGGTAIWRCYSGNRFSEDVDVYIEKNTEKIERFFEELGRAGFQIVKRRATKNSLYSLLSFERTEVRFEATFKNVRGTVKEYETYEGILFNVFTLDSEEMIREKISAYLKRRKIRDLYDIFFMLRYVEEKDKLKPDLQKLLREFKPPVDERELKALIIFGAIPTKDDLVEYLRRMVK
jgi:predicted nucleotidyltransferase component of viral defense system